MGSGASAPQPRITVMKVVPANNEDRKGEPFADSGRGGLARFSPFHSKKKEVAQSRKSAFVMPTFGKTDGEKFTRKSHGGTVKMRVEEGAMNGKVPQGKYKLGDLCNFPDLQIRPPCAEIRPMRWVEGKPHGQIMLPENWNCEIPVVYATGPYLSYYNCSFGNMNEGTLRVKWAHEFLDFTYGDDYKEKWILDPSLGAGGLGIEKHKFIHMECPLSDDSGYFILGRMEDDPYSLDQVLKLTAFIFPVYHTVFISPDAIHSNDHLKGLWRTMLSAFSPQDMKLGLNDIDHCILRIPGEDGDMQNADLNFANARTSQKALVKHNWTPNLLESRFAAGAETGVGRKSAVGLVPTHKIAK